MKPTTLPSNPNFSSGPCSKRPGYDVSKLDLSTLGRSHRSALGKETLSNAIELTKEVLGIPSDYRVAIVAGSDTGAVEMCLWSMLGERGVDMMAWESFGAGWQTDVVKQLKLDNVNLINADYGEISDLSKVNSDNDLVFTWNGTTSGVKLANGDWIDDNRQGLTICDATSAVFAMELPWNKLDVTTFSWQKVLGGEAAHGIIVLSPKAVARLESYTPSWPLPKIFRMTKAGKLDEALFTGATINTPSMLCVADYLDALNWVQEIGGLKAAIQRSEDNLDLFKTFVANNDWIEFLAKDEAHISNTSICFSLKATADQSKALVKLLATEKAAFDIGSYKDAPAGIRIWGGATVSSSDIEALLPWLSWAYAEVTK